MIIKPHQTELHHLLGGKANALARLAETGANIPAWFAVTSIDTEEVKIQVIDLADSLHAANFAVRSSALEEDGAEHSFAGQFDSFLYVAKEELLEKIAAVFQSNVSDHLETYVGTKNIKNNDSNSVTALVQKMITPDISGVAFSADPVSGDCSKTVISALWGTGSALVSGDADADTWTLKDGNVIDLTIAKKTHQHMAGNDTEEGIKRTSVPSEKQNIACLTDSQLTKVADLAELCEKHFGCPQDIEWALADNTLYLLQSRPITTLTPQPEPSEPLTVWDNSNIAESYSGITSPLTFTFAERIYEHVYREFCILLSVPKGRVKKHDVVFPKMLGHIHGHVYYNLNSWYHVLAMLPGFSINRGFMEQMMGVKVPMPDEVIERIVEQTKTNKIYDGFSLVKMLFGLIRNQVKLEKNIKRFYKRLNSALDAPEIPLSEMSQDELIAHYNDLEAKLLKRWDAPLVNDFFAMIYYGFLKSLCEKWLGDSSLQNTLLLDSGEIISAEPPRRIAEMATMVRAHTSLKEQLASDLSDDEKLREIANYPELQTALDAYLDKFGDRCLEELKLESPSVRDNSTTLLSSISAMANREPKEVKEVTESTDLDDARERLSGLKRKIFDWVLRNARDRVRDRENLRFERTRLFGRVRNIMIHLGDKLANNNQLSHGRDVFYLHLTEAVSGEKTNYQSIVSKRKGEEESYRNQTPPPDRFHTVAPISEYSSFQSALPYTAPDGDNISGIGACPGVVRGKVRVVLDPREASLKEGEILVAQQTDPGWVVLFPAASGLLVERGSLLSHSAIVARELNLACIVSIPDVTKVLNTGDLIEMNGKTGEVTILNHE
ncbi:MAG: phosphohistidine swiveling domain-containing protein [Rubritalea sp.]|jgi:phosphohistidine swiveling domain-containing protein